MSDSKQPDEKPRSSLPEPTGASFCVPPRPDHVRHRRRKEDKVVDTALKEYELKHRSEIAYPAAYKPVSTEFWQGLSQDQVDAVMRLQAVAVEKAGFEKSTEKFFIQNFDPANPNAPTGVSRPRGSDLDLVSMAAPRFVLGGVLLGMGSLALALTLAGVLSPLAPVATAAVIALIIGIMLAVNARGR